MKTAAFHLIPQDQLGPLHLRVSLFLRQSPFLDDFIFDAADHAVLARDFGALEDSNADLVQLLLDAGSRAAISASFMAAKRYLDVASGELKTTICAYHQLSFNQTADVSDGFPVIVKCIFDTPVCFRRCAACFSYITRLSAVYAIRNDQADGQLREMVPLCQTDVERVRIATYRVRLKIACM